MSTKHQRAEELRMEYLRMESDPYKAPEQVEAARQAWFRAVRGLRPSDRPASVCSCLDPDSPFCEAHPGDDRNGGGT